MGAEEKQGFIQPLSPCPSLFMSVSSVSAYLCISLSLSHTQGQPAAKEEPTSPQSQASEGRMWFLGISCSDLHRSPCLGGSPAQERSCTLTAASPGLTPPFTRGAPPPALFHHPGEGFQMAEDKQVRTPE